MTGLEVTFRRLFVTCDVFTRSFFVAFPWLCRGPHLLGKQCSWLLHPAFAWPSFWADLTRTRPRKVFWVYVLPFFPTKRGNTLTNSTRIHSRDDPETLFMFVGFSLPWVTCAANPWLFRGPHLLAKTVFRGPHFGQVLGVLARRWPHYSSTLGGGGGFWLFLFFLSFSFRALQKLHMFLDIPCAISTRHVQYIRKRHMTLKLAGPQLDA